MRRFTCFFLLFLSLNILAFSAESFDTKGIDYIHIDAKFIDLHIDSYDGDKILIEQTSGDKDDKNIEVSSSIDNNILNVNLTNNKDYTFYRSRINVNISIPSDYITEYNIESENSSLDIKNIKGDIVTDSKNTGVSFMNLEGNLAINTSKKVVYLANIVGDIDIKGDAVKVITKNTEGVLNIVTNNKKIDIENASVINNISTSDASIYADFRGVTQTSKIVTNDHSITITIPDEHQYSFSIFGDLIKVSNDFEKKVYNSDQFDDFLILGTSNAKIRIKSRD